MSIDADHPCANCGRAFADHDYVTDSIVTYKCPVPHIESGYGFFAGGDPRNFHPDYECCSEEEIANHQRACEEAARLGNVNLNCPSGWEQVGDAVVHVLRSPFGVGVYTVEFEQYFEPADIEATNEDDVL